VIVLADIATNRSPWPSVTAERGRVRTRRSPSASVTYQATPWTTTLQPSSLERKSSASKATTPRMWRWRAWCFVPCGEDRSLGGTEKDRKQSGAGRGLFNVLVHSRPLDQGVLATLSRSPGLRSGRHQGSRLARASTWVPWPAPRLSSTAVTRA